MIIEYNSFTLGGQESKWFSGGWAMQWIKLVILDSIVG